MTERLEIFSDQRLKEYGESGYHYYETQAEGSGVPPCFLEVAQAYLYELPGFKEMPPTDVARMLFNTQFDTNREAWIAINYAKAIALVKRADDDEDNEIDGNRLLLGVGIATMLEESEDDSVEIVKERVEEIFSDPREGLRVAQMYEDLKVGYFH